MIAQRHGGRWIAPAALGLGLLLALGACVDPATHTEPAGSAAHGAAVADLTNDGATCEEEVRSELQAIFAEHKLVVTDPVVWDGHLGDLIDRACRKFPDRAASKTAEWVFRCSGVGAHAWLEGIEAVDTDEGDPIGGSGQPV